MSAADRQAAAQTDNGPAPPESVYEAIPANQSKRIVQCCRFLSYNFTNGAGERLYVSSRSQANPGSDPVPLLVGRIASKRRRIVP